MWPYLTADTGIHVQEGEIYALVNSSSLCHEVLSHVQMEVERSKEVMSLTYCHILLNGNSRPQIYLPLLFYKVLHPYLAPHFPKA